jgi:hypothetical protein
MMASSYYIIISSPFHPLQLVSAEKFTRAEVPKRHPSLKAIISKKVRFVEVDCDNYQSTIN